MCVAAPLGCAHSAAQKHYYWAVNYTGKQV